MKHIIYLVLSLVIANFAFTTGPGKGNRVGESAIIRLAEKKASLIITNASNDNRLLGLNAIDTTDIKIYKGCYSAQGDTAFYFSFKCHVVDMGKVFKDRLNLLCHMHDSLIVDYYEQGVLPDTILDFDKDGIDDFFFHYFSENESYQFDDYQIKNYAGKQEHKIFQLGDLSTYGVGEFDNSKEGDTVLTTRLFNFINANKNRPYEIIMSSEFKVKGKRGYKDYGNGKIARDIKESYIARKSVDTLRFINRMYGPPAYKSKIPGR